MSGRGDRVRYRALAAVAAGACLVLCGCGGAGAPAAAGGSSAAASGTTTAKFCQDAAAFMRHIPQAPATKHLTAAAAAANMKTVLAATITGFSALQTQAPATIRKPLRKIVRMYQQDEQVLQRTGSLSAATEAMSKSNQSGVASFTKVLKYISGHCH